MRSKAFFITTIFPPDVGGPATYVHATSAALFARGWQVAVVTYAKNPAQCPFPVISVASIFPFSVVRLVWALFRHGYAYGTWYGNGGLSATLPAFFMARIFRKRYGIKITGDYAWETARNRGWTSLSVDDFQGAHHGLRTIILAFLRAWIARRADFIIVPSRYLRTMVVGWGVAAEKITVVPNTAPAVLLRSPVTRDPYLFFTAGRLVPWKNFDGVIRVFAECLRAESRARLVVAGDGPCRVGLEALAARLNVVSSVSFVGFVSREVMDAFFARAGCFILFSEYEGLSHVLLEAAAHGIPSIVSDAGGNAEAVADNPNATLVARGDEQALIYAMKKFLKNSA